MGAQLALDLFWSTRSHTRHSRCITCVHASIFHPCGLFPPHCSTLSGGFVYFYVNTKTHTALKHPRTGGRRKEQRAYPRGDAPRYTPVHWTVKTLRNIITWTWQDAWKHVRPCVDRFSFTFVRYTDEKKIYIYAVYIYILCTLFLRASASACHRRQLIPWHHFPKLTL